MVMFLALNPWGLLFAFARGPSELRCIDWNKKRKLHRGKQRLQDNGAPSIFCGRIRALEPIDESDASHHSPGASE
jgi:hypothetical protein